MMLYLLLNPLENLHGSVRPPFLLARELRKGSDVVIVSPIISDTIHNKMLELQGLKVQSLNKRYRFSSSLLTFEAWLKAFEFKPSEVDSVLLNFSQCFIVNAHVYYAQGPVTRAIDDMYPTLKRIYRFVYRLARPFLVRRDKGFNWELRRRSRFFIANSKFCASMYKDWGIKVDSVIYPPLDCELFKPTTSGPISDYILTYIGKEAKYSVLKAIANAGVRIKAFGSKASYIPKSLLNHPNIELLGKVSDEELANLYSNALYTLFTFTHEPFGYIPVESMACGTPVLTYNKQGPGETVIHNVTGWLADTDEELVELAVRLSREGYPSWMRVKCRERALEFDVKAIADKWLKIIKQLA